MSDEGGGGAASPPISNGASDTHSSSGVSDDNSSSLRAPREDRVRGQMSSTSKNLIDKAHELLGMAPSIAEGKIANPSPIPTISRGLVKSRSSSPDSGLFSSHSSSTTVPRLNPIPTFKRIDFDDREYAEVEDRKPAWRKLEESVKDSYHTAKRSADRTKDESEWLESNYLTRPTAKRGESPFGRLSSESFMPRSRFLSSSSLGPRVNSSASMSTVYGGSGPYASPAVDRTQGIESRYEQRIGEIERNYMRGTCLPSSSMRSITMKEFRNAPAPAAGSTSEHDDYDFSAYAPKPYYSRPTRDDPDYFDFDLDHSVNMYRRPEGSYVPKKPQEWENKLLAESRIKGTASLSGHMFKNETSDWRTTNTSLLSAALRTPKFWEQRFESIGQQVRDSNPISLDSINRQVLHGDTVSLNRPTPSRFTEYRDPDFEDYDDPRED